MLTGERGLPGPAARPVPPPLPPLPLPPPITIRNLWDLRADPGTLRRGAQGWRGVGEAQRTCAGTVDGSARRVVTDSWTGAAADSYREHQIRLTDDIEEAGPLSGRVAAALDVTAGVLASAQSKLANSLNQVRATCPVKVSGNEVTFRPQDTTDVAVVARAIGDAVTIRAELDQQLLGAVAQLNNVVPELATIADAWQSLAEGTNTTDPFILPPEAPGTGIIYDFTKLTKQRFIINTGNGDDTVWVRVDPATGQRTVVINGVEHRVPDGTAITVRTGEGNDTITVPAGTRINLTLLGSKGDDRIIGGSGNDRILAGDGSDVVAGNGGDDNVSAGSGNDTVTTGSGNDTVAGGSGNDNIDTGEGHDYASGGDGMDYLYGYRGRDSLHGGGDDDVIYGGGNDDTVSGGSGRDFVDGGRGNDRADGGSDNDIVSGGRGDDLVLGGSGDDTLVAGAGKDTVEGGTGQDKAYTQNEDSTSAENVVTVVVNNDAGHTIRIEGSPEFQERVRDDSDLLQSLPDGQKMLLSIDQVHDASRGRPNDGNTLTITETPDLNGYADKLDYGTREDYTVEYNPGFYGHGEGGRPITVLYHEFAHVYDFGHDTEAPGHYDHPGAPDHGQYNAERAAVGLPITDWRDGTEGPQSGHPHKYTENGIRGELGLPPRENFSVGSARDDPPSK